VAAAPSEDIIGPYRNSLAAHLRPYQHYPLLARSRHEEGLVVVHVTVQRDGHIAAMSIEHGSGFESLDREALATLKRADPLPPVPAGMPGATMELSFPLRFQME
jgi:protein TonB